MYELGNKYGAKLQWVHELGDKSQKTAARTGYDTQAAPIDHPVKKLEEQSGSHECDEKGGGVARRATSRCRDQTLRTNEAVVGNEGSRHEIMDMGEEAHT